MTTPYIDPQTVHNPATGTSPPASWGDTVRDDLEFLARTPGCICNRTTIQSIATSTFTPLSFTAADIRDTDGYHSTVTNPSRMTVPAGLGGLYEIGANVGWGTPSATGIRIVRLRKNGTTEFGSVDTVGHGANVIFQNICVPAYLNAGDYVEIMLLHNAGITLDTYPAIAQIGWMRLVAVS